MQAGDQIARGLGRDGGVVRGVAAQNGDHLAFEQGRAARDHRKARGLAGGRVLDGFRADRADEPVDREPLGPFAQHAAHLDPADRPAPAGLHRSLHGIGFVHVPWQIARPFRQPAPRPARRHKGAGGFVRRAHAQASAIGAAPPRW